MTTNYERAADRIARALNPIVDAAQKALVEAREVLDGTPIEEGGPADGFVSAIPPMVIDRAETAKRAVNSCIKAIVDEAADKMSATLAGASPSPQPELLFGAPPS